MAREALSSGDKILSENYFQHADHFTRILSDQENFKKARFSKETSEGIKISGDNVDENLTKDEQQTKVVVSK